MIVTIQAPTPSRKADGLWAAEMMMGLEVENHMGSTFDVIVHRQDKLDALLSKCGGKVIATRHIAQTLGSPSEMAGSLADADFIDISIKLYDYDKNSPAFPLDIAYYDVVDYAP